MIILMMVKIMVITKHAGDGSIIMMTGDTHLV